LEFLSQFQNQYLKNGIFSTTEANERLKTTDPRPIDLDLNGLSPPSEKKVGPGGQKAWPSSFPTSERGVVKAKPSEQDNLFYFEPREKRPVFPSKRTTFRPTKTKDVETSQSPETLSSEDLFYENRVKIF